MNVGTFYESKIDFIASEKIPAYVSSVGLILSKWPDFNTLRIVLMVAEKRDVS